MPEGPRRDLLDGRYEVGPVIGRGGMGEVRRGRDMRLGRDVAIKFLRADLAAEPDVRRRFEDEARAAARVTHPAAVTVFDSGEEAGTPYLVMECLPGRTLGDEIAGGPLPPGHVRQIAVEVLGALAAAHQVGMVHRDVKPGNILLTAGGQAKLADFGIAKSTEGLMLTVTGQILGTAAYMAPERLAGEPATPSTDLYSLGVVLYEALTGDKPFRGDNPAALAHAVHTTSPPPIAERCPGVEADLASAIDRAISKHPAERFRDASDMRAMFLAPERQPLDMRTTTVPEVDTGADVITSALRPDTMVATPPPPRPETVVAGSSPLSTRNRWHRRTSRERQVVAALGVAVLAVFLFLVANRDGDGVTGETPSTTAPPTSTVPEPLDDAIRELEESVRP